VKKARKIKRDDHQQTSLPEYAERFIQTPFFPGPGKLLLTGITGQQVHQYRYDGSQEF